MATFQQYTNKTSGEKFWLFKTYLGIDPATGRQVTTSRRSFRNKKEAVLAEKRLQLEYQKNKGLKKEASNTFKEIYELWFETYVKTVKEGTVIGTESAFRVHILPILGSLKVAKMDVKTCQKAVNVWENCPLGCSNLISRASRIMKFALNMDLIAYNPFERVIRPIKKATQEKKLKFYTRDQLEIMLNFLSNQIDSAEKKPLINQYMSQYYEALIRLLAFSGIRIGEAFALNHSDIDFEKGMLTINKTITTTKIGVAISSPKTRASNRVIPLDAKTLQVLKKWQLKQKEFLFSNRVKNCELVFPSIDGELQNTRRIFQLVNELAEKAKLPPIGLHGYRHTHASLLFEAGATMKEVQARLGHSNIEMTMNIYTHVTENVKAETVEKLVKFANF